MSITTRNHYRIKTITKCFNISETVRAHCCSITELGQNAKGPVWRIHYLIIGLVKFPNQPLNTHFHKAVWKQCKKRVLLKHSHKNIIKQSAWSSPSIIRKTFAIVLWSDEIKTQLFFGHTPSARWATRRDCVHGKSPDTQCQVPLWKTKLNYHSVPPSRVFPCSDYNGFQHCPIQLYGFALNPYCCLCLGRFCTWTLLYLLTLQPSGPQKELTRIPRRSSLTRMAFLEWWFELH